MYCDITADYSVPSFLSCFSASYVQIVSKLMFLRKSNKINVISKQQYITIYIVDIDNDCINQIFILMSVLKLDL